MPTTTVAGIDWIEKSGTQSGPSIWDAATQTLDPSSSLSSKVHVSKELGLGEKLELNLSLSKLEAQCSRRQLLWQALPHCCLHFLLSKNSGDVLLPPPVFLPLIYPQCRLLSMLLTISNSPPLPFHHLNGPSWFPTQMVAAVFCNSVHLSKRVPVQLLQKSTEATNLSQHELVTFGLMFWGVCNKNISQTFPQTWECCPVSLSFYLCHSFNWTLLKLWKSYIPDII